ncbi:MAG: RagB/SusD family nutrient uptake outer membrane protein [Bacteroidales bacterium]|nr:RagB/SusD family nutrient uptake outer membrane protein [Bacteroidales bacterium]MCI2121675.1 RagB/SusD family nutrient uptake outer membrane protein [Bacteroidales bacterium]MCI2144640.1 RagB/SusD family nutrient uptake outer membrane protein [Bacteroidales bacterium]
MKNINFISILFASVLLASCSGYLDKYPYDAVSTDATVTEDVALALTNACYKPLQSSNLYNMRMWSLDIIAGNSNVGAGGGTDGIETVQASNFTCTSDNGFALYVWRSPWVGINRCNIVLNDVAKADIDTNVKDRCLGEAYFLRAHYYFILAQLFGGVPVLTEPHNANESTAIARNTLEETYARIISDCQNAIDLLPAKSSYSSSDIGRASKDAALTMLAKVYLVLAPSEKSYYQNVVDLCDQVTALGYDLTKCNYADNFGTKADNGPESIFEIQYSGSTDYDFWGSDCQSSWLSTFMGPRNSGMVAGAYGWNQPTEEFMSRYEEGDLRKDVTVFYDGCPDFDGIAYDPAFSATGYNVRKFLVSKSDSPEYNTNGSDFVVYRYSDILLMKAEALNETGSTVLAYAPLNIVRERAGLPDISGQSQSELRETIIHERRMEFAFEGQSWFDLIRIGKNGEYAVSFLKSIGKSNVNTDRLLLPIPQTEMDSNSAMTQNPGY